MSQSARAATDNNMRTIKTHIVEGDSVNHQLEIRVLDEPGAGGANHEYEVLMPSDYMELHPTMEKCRISFQNGPIKEVGVNGVTQEALLAIVIDRLECFQAGPYSTVMNAQALTHCRSALDCLQERTRERIKRQVEGTHQQ
jgi:hypothetical protein